MGSSPTPGTGTIGCMLDLLHKLMGLIAMLVDMVANWYLHAGFRYQVMRSTFFNGPLAEWQTQRI